VYRNFFRRKAVRRVKKGVCVELSFDLKSRDAENAVCSDATMKGLVDLGDIQRCECGGLKERSTIWCKVVCATIHKLRANETPLL
jgi:hypothetical protein